MKSDEYKIHPIAHIRTDFGDKFGLPRQSGRAPSLIGKIEFLPEYGTPEAVRGIEGFSHLWLIFGFSAAEKESGGLTVRPPRLGGNTRVGVFASRSPFRPNSLGLSSVKLEKIETTDDGCILTVSGVDLLDMTPIYDIKPYLPSSDIHADAVGGYADEFRDYFLDVDFSDELLSVLPAEKRAAAIECLRDDPRPAYQNDDGRVYGMKFAGFDIKFSVKDKKLTVLQVDI